MGKKESSRLELVPLLENYLAGGGTEPLYLYLKNNSALPGPRGNLELADAFGDVMAELSTAHLVPLWRLCIGMSEIAPEEAPVNNRAEFLPFCGTVGLGALGPASADHRPLALDKLRALARDPRWRMREGTCFALQRVLATAPDEVLSTLHRWVDGGHPLELRAVVAAVADPPLLQNPQVASEAMVLHRRVLQAVAATPSDQRRAEPFKILRQGLAFTLSVVIVPLPEEGFAFLHELVASPDADVRWIVNQNLKKKRLTSAHPHLVNDLLRQTAAFGS